VKGLVRLHGLLLRLYPAGFRHQFGDEMTDAFAQSLAERRRQGSRAMATVCLRELVHLPVSLWREHWHEYAYRGRRIMNGADLNPTGELDAGTVAPPASRADIAAAVFPFVLIGLMFILKGLDYHLHHPRQLWLVSGVTGYLIVHGLLLVGLGAGWALRFPRWSYPYLGVTLITSGWLAGVVTRGYELFGYTFGSERWGWRAWVPMLVLAAVMLLVTRSVGPLRALFRGIWDDWTRLPLAFYAALTWLWLGVAYDNKTWYDQTAYLPLDLFVLTLLIVAGTYFHMRARRPVMRVLALQAVALFYVPMSGVVEVLTGRFELSWPVNVAPWLFWLLIWSAAMFLPGLLGWARRGQGAGRRA
jgi:hypothetical protein